MHVFVPHRHIWHIKRIPELKQDAPIGTMNTPAQVHDRSSQSQDRY